ncbi:MAG: ribosome silencing factor [Cellvibrionales bacterium TMED49]|nr:ribosome silencing factor [Porticoccaceae bacterium]OUU38283.1 MAG: ribosome silencing factor [Cellvibrionales bacterium TMED49]|tara:strand:+ start:1619 stop:2008 length:390 start_codon:yes stop_codon:yes gene_type:complete
MKHTLQNIIVGSLEDAKVFDITRLDVRSNCNITDEMIIATGSSTRQVKSACKHVINNVKTRGGLRPIGIEGEDVSEWILIDFGDVVIHIMLQSIREFYRLERLWSFSNISEEEIFPNIEKTKSSQPSCK